MRSRATMPRAYNNCYYPSTPRGLPDMTDGLTFGATPGYARYDWTPGTAFNDATLANPTFAADNNLIRCGCGRRHPYRRKD